MNLLRISLPAAEAFKTSQAHLALRYSRRTWPRVSLLSLVYRDAEQLLTDVTNACIERAAASIIRGISQYVCTTHMAIVETHADANQLNPKSQMTSGQETAGNMRLLHVKHSEGVSLVLPRPFPGMFSAKSYNGPSSASFTLDGRW